MGSGHASVALVQRSLVHGYTVGFWWMAGIFVAGGPGVPVVTG
jgi:hypothetical protein